MKRILIIGLFIGFFSFLAFAGVGEEYRADTAKINAANRYALENYRINPDSCFTLAREALSLSQRMDYQKGIADSYNSLAYTHFLNYASNDSALFYFNKAYAEYETLNDSKGKGTASYGLSYYYQFKGDMKESEKYILRSLAEYEEADFKRGVCVALNALSTYNRNDKEKAFEYINRAISIAEQAGYKSLLANLYNSLGNLYQDQTLFQQAIDIYFKALEIWEEVKDSAGLAIAYGSLGNMYYYQKDYDNAKKFYLKKIDLSKKANDFWELSKTYNNMSLLFNVRSKYDSSLYYLKESLDLCIGMNYPTGIAGSYSALGNTYFLAHENDSALHYINKSIIISRNIGDRRVLAKNYILQGKIYMRLKKPGSAMDYLMKGYLLAKEVNLAYETFDAANDISNLYLMRGDYKLAYQYYKEGQELLHKIQEEANIKKITQLSMQYEFDKKQRIMELETAREKQANEAALKQQRMYLKGAVIFIIFLLLFGVLFIRQKNMQARLKTIELGQKLLRSQMNPHFIFNSLSAIQNFMLNNDTKSASHFLSRFASLMRQILINSREEYITIEKEENTLSNYLETQKLRFGRNFNYKIQIDKEIDREIMAIPPMMAQPFIENSIEHGLLPKQGEGTVMVRFILNGEYIELEVEDNGIGRKASMEGKQEEKEKKRKSLAIELTRERLIYLKKKTGKNIDFTIEDLLENGKPSGTRVRFKIPFQKIYG
jgi:tetratricopeptide (TPR) repeat protein